jgi:hypothetical protein
VFPLTVAPSQFAGVGWMARPTLAPASWSPSWELTSSSVFRGAALSDDGRARPADAAAGPAGGTAGHLASRGLTLRISLL